MALPVSSSTDTLTEQTTLPITEANLAQANAEHVEATLEAATLRLEQLGDHVHFTVPVEPSSPTVISTPTVVGTPSRDSWLFTKEKEHHQKGAFDAGQWTPTSPLAHHHSESYFPSNGATTPRNEEATVGKKTDDDEDDIGPAPDGGLNAWLSVVSYFFAVFVQFGLSNSFGVFQNYYTTLLPGTSASTIGWIGGLQMFVLCFGGIVLGPMFDRYGALPLLIPGSVCAALGLILTSFCKTYWQILLSHGVLFGIGSSLLFHPTCAACAQWWDKRSALALGVGAMGSGLGGIAWPIACRLLIDKVGFAWTMRIIGLISFAMCGITLATSRVRVPPQKNSKDQVAWTAVFEPLAELDFMLLAVGTGLTIWGAYLPLNFISTNSLRLGSDDSLAFYLLAIVNAGTTVGRLLSAVGDSCGRFNLTIATQLGCGLLILVFWIPLTSVNALIAFGVIYGIVAGAWLSIYFVALAQISTAKNIGRRSGLLWAVLSIFGLTGTPICGAIISKFDGARGYQYAGIFSGGACLLGAALVIWARFRLDKRWLAAV